MDTWPVTVAVPSLGVQTELGAARGTGCPRRERETLTATCRVLDGSLTCRGEVMLHHWL